MTTRVDVPSAASCSSTRAVPSGRAGVEHEPSARVGLHDLGVVVDLQGTHADAVGSSFPAGANRLRVADVSEPTTR